MALQGGFGGPTRTAVDGTGAQVVFARLRLKVTGGLVPGATYTMTAPFGSKTFVAEARGTIDFTDDQGCGATPPACAFSFALAQPNVGPFLQWDPAVSLPPAGFIGHPATDHAIIGSPFGTNFFRLAGPDVGGPGIKVVQTNLFSVTGKIFVSPVTHSSLVVPLDPPFSTSLTTLTAPPGTQSVNAPEPSTLTLTGWGLGGLGGLAWRRHRRK